MAKLFGNLLKDSVLYQFDEANILFSLDSLYDAKMPMPKKQGQQSNDAPSVVRFIIVFIFVFFYLHFLLLFCFFSVVKLSCFLILETRVFPISGMDLWMDGWIDGWTDRWTDPLIEMQRRIQKSLILIQIVQCMHHISMHVNAYLFW